MKHHIDLLQYRTEVADVTQSNSIDIDDFSCPSSKITPVSQTTEQDTTSQGTTGHPGRNYPMRQHNRLTLSFDGQSHS